MFLGDLLVAHGLVTQSDVAQALERQKAVGGLLGENLIALGIISAGELEGVMRAAPAAPRNIAQTGLQLPDLLNLFTKAMYATNAETPSKLGEILKLTNRVIQLIIEQANDRKLLEVRGGETGYALSEPRYGLSEKGKRWALDALAQNQYVGPAPVTLEDYADRIRRQRIGNEHVGKAAINRVFSNMIVSERFIQQIGPALNSGSSILLYGPPGNGKTSVAERIGTVFTDVIYIPYCFEVDGQIIKVFDPSVHKNVQPASDPAMRGTALRSEDFDRRWVACRRPFVVTGGELTLEMLDLSFNTLAKYYEAPLHVKALGGIFVIDDFGRQIVTPEALLNRWIVPLESRVEFLKLHTGKGLSLPFDELVIFSTNLKPADLMDPAFLRRIPYKLEVGAPTPEDYRRIFHMTSEAMGLSASDEVINYVITELREHNDFALAGYQPKFIVEQIKSASKFQGVPPQFTPELISMALSNMHTKDTPGYGVRSTASRGQTH
ncbi:MAG: AAA family ATPase [Bauldia sp.]|nr:AAA family ATPase [Bauldia sp.]